MAWKLEGGNHLYAIVEVCLPQKISNWSDFASSLKICNTLLLWFWLTLTNLLNRKSNKIANFIREHIMSLTIFFSSEVNFSSFILLKIFKKNFNFSTVTIVIRCLPSIKYGQWKMILWPYCNTKIFFSIAIALQHCVEVINSQKPILFIKLYGILLIWFWLIIISS